MSSSPYCDAHKNSSDGESDHAKAPTSTRQAFGIRTSNTGCSSYWYLKRIFGSVGVKVKKKKLYDQPVQWPEACKALQSIFDSTLDLSRHSRRLRYRDIVLSDSISRTAPLREH